MEPFRLNRRFLLLAGVALALPVPALAADRPSPETVVLTWYRLILELIRHTATYSPPVASRAFAYLGVTAYESLAAGNPALRTLAGQLNALQPLPVLDPGQIYDPSAILNAALSEAVHFFFGNTGPTGQRAMKAMGAQLDKTNADLPTDVALRSQQHGRAIAAHIIAWSMDDGGAVVENMGFPYEYTLTPGPAHWVPTSLIRQQQMPLLPLWGNNRPFAVPVDQPCTLPPPPAYSEDPASAFYAEAMEVYQLSKTLTDEQKTIARFWSDDPMLSPTPPGHWVSVVLEIIDRDGLDAARAADALMRIGVAVADAFIGCWQQKFAYDMVRPVTYIRRVIDPKWETLLITPPFPEYPSGHSTQSGAAATVLTAVFGDHFTFTDSTHVDDGIPARSFPDFHSAAAEAGISRLYGGIHFRSANENGLAQGACIGAHTNGLKTL